MSRHTEHKINLEGFNPLWLDARDIKILNKHDCGLCNIKEDMIHEILTKQDLVRFETAKKLVRWWVFLLYVYPTLSFEQVAPHFCDRGGIIEQYMDNEEFTEFQLELAIGYKAFGELWAEILDVDLTELVNVDPHTPVVANIARDIMRLLAMVKARHVVTNNLYTMGDRLVLYWVIKRQCKWYKNPWCFRYDLTQALQHVAPSPSPESSGLYREA